MEDFFFSSALGEGEGEDGGEEGGSDEKAVFSKIDSYYIYSVLAYESEGIQR